MIARKTKIYLLIIILFFTSLAFSKTLPLSSKLIALNSPQGEEIFERSYSGKYFWPLIFQFIHQQNLTYCTIASSVMVLNALDIPAPSEPDLSPYQYFTQKNFFTPAVEKILPITQLKKSGATLNQVGHAIAIFPVSVKIIHVDESTADQFRLLAKKAISHGAYILVNFSRPYLGQSGNGHMSPIGAYDEISDRFLILDVAKFRYPPFWVKTQDLWKAMHTIDKGAHAYRGFVIVAKNDEAIDNYT